MMRGSRLITPHSYAASSPFCLMTRFISSLAFSTSCSIFAGWIRPSAIRFSKATRAICRLTGSKEEIVIAPGTSSTKSSTPVSRSNALIFRPSLPIILPLTSSEGIVTCDVKTSTETDEASRWIVVANIFLAFSSNTSSPAISSL